MKHDGNDLLRRQDCINAIEEITSSMSVCVNTDECHGMKRMQRQAVLEIANMPAVQPDHVADISKKVERTAETAQNTSSSCTHENDVIFRKAAIDAVVDEFKRSPTPAIRAKLRLEALPPAQPEKRWIPCSERLPYAEYGESDNVLATCGYRDVEDGSIRWIKTLYFNGGNWCHPTGETYLEKVYAWMPLPAPYKGGETE